MPGYSDPGFDTLALHAGASPDPATGARELDDWRAGLPFEIEVSVVGGAKAYRKVSRA